MRNRVARTYLLLGAGLAVASLGVAPPAHADDDDDDRRRGRVYRDRGWDDDDWRDRARWERGPRARPHRHGAWCPPGHRRPPGVRLGWWNDRTRGRWDDWDVRDRRDWKEYRDRRFDRRWDALDRTGSWWWRDDVRDRYVPRPVPTHRGRW